MIRSEDRLDNIFMYNRIAGIGSAMISSFEFALSPNKWNADRHNHFMGRNT